MPRITSVDAFRGFVMFLMLAGVMRLSKVADAYPDCATLQAVKFHTSHVDWVGCSLHDLIQPGFTFLVGVALTFSLARRAERPVGRLLLHAAWRSLVLVWLGVFLRSSSARWKTTNFTFEDTLSQIGLGYLPLVVIALFKPRVWLLALVVILIGYWALFAFWPLPPEGFDRATVGVDATWTHDATGFEAHWNLNHNPAAAFDAVVLKRLRGDTDESYKSNAGGYATLSFVPTLGTMLLGLFAGRWLQTGGSPWQKVGLFLLVGVGLLAAGYGLGAAGVCPVVKKIWTPSWVLVSGGYCFLLLAAFHALTDATGYGGWSYPLRVIGANSILIYAVAGLGVGDFIKDSFRKHFGQDVFAVCGEQWKDAAGGATVLVVYWLGLWWLYARKVFVRV